MIIFFLLRQNDSPMPVFNAEITRIRPSGGQSTSTDMSSMDVATTTHAQPNSIACGSKTSAAGKAKRRSSGPSLVRPEKLLMPAALIRQKQMNDLDRRASDAQSAMPSTSAAIDLDECDEAGVIVVALPKSQLPRTISASFAPVTFSTPVQAARPKSSHLLTTNSAVSRPSISPVLIEETPVTASVPMQDAHMERNQPSVQPPMTPHRVAKQTRIPLWTRDSTRKATLVAATTTSALQLPIPEIGTPKSSLAPTLKVVSDANPSARPPPIPEAVGKAPTPIVNQQTLTINLNVDNRPAASPQCAPQTNQTDANVCPVNSNRVTSTIPTKKQTTNEPSDELLMTDDEENDQMNEARQLPMWKAVSNRHATPGVNLNENRRIEPNKSLRRQLFHPRKSNSNQSQSADEQPEQPEPIDLTDDEVAAGADEGVAELVNTHRKSRSQTRKTHDTHSIALEQSTANRPMSQTYDKERASLRNYTYDVVNSVNGSQPNASASHAMEPESSGRPSVVGNDDNPVNDAMAVDEALGGNDSSTNASSTSSNYENIPHIVSVQYLHPNHANAISIVLDSVQQSSPTKPMKSPESTTTDNRTPNRLSRRTVLAPLSRTNNQSVRLPSLSIATSTTNAVRESETFTSVLPPENFQDDIITEHSPTVVRDSIKQVSVD